MGFERIGEITDIITITSTWNGRAYDPTSKPPYYHHELDDYLNIMERNGFQPHLITQSKIG